MALKRKSKTNANFSMASMTDIIFLLLIFFMITSTVVVPNAIKVNLPQAQRQTAAKPLSRVTIDKNLNYYVAHGNQRERKVTFEDIVPFLQERFEQEPDMYVALYADEAVPYGKVVEVMHIAYINKFNMLFMTRPPAK